MSILDEIKDKLTAIDANTFYGTAAKLPNDAPWNYTVFNRGFSRANAVKWTNEYIVNVVRENYIPDGMKDEIVNAICSIKGMRLADDYQVEYVYDIKPNTDRTLEMMTIPFVQATKRCQNG